MTKKSAQLKSAGIVIRQFRQAASMSQEELGHNMNVSATYISLLESGKRYPSIGTLIRLAEAIGVSPGEMLDGIAGKENQKS